MLNLRPFQIILYGIFLALAIAGVIAFATFRATNSGALLYGSGVEIWGTLPQGAFNSAIQTIAVDEEEEGFNVVRYVEKDPRTFANELANAIAEGRGPDAVVLSHEELVRERGKLYAIPYETISRRTFIDTYVDGAELFLLRDGVYGFPIAVDPLMMYWNQDLFSSNGFSLPPTTWEGLVAQTVPTITRVSPGLDVLQSAIAFGEYANIRHAKELMLLLMIQAGSALTSEEERGYDIDINTADSTNSRPPGDAALDFYTQFANPSRSVYSWNRSLPQAQSEFLAEDLALYFGFASELRELQNGNPNLNFDAAKVPQGEGATILKSYGRFYTLALLRSTDNFQGSFRAISRLAGRTSAQRISEGLTMAPVHRNTIAGGHPDPFRQAIYDSALITRGWLDPDPDASENIFKMMIEDVTSGRLKISDSVDDTETRLEQLFR